MTPDEAFAVVLDFENDTGYKFNETEREYMKIFLLWWEASRAKSDSKVD